MKNIRNFTNSMNIRYIYNKYECFQILNIYTSNNICSITRDINFYVQNSLSFFNMNLNKKNIDMYIKKELIKLANIFYCLLYF